MIGEGAETMADTLVQLEQIWMYRGYAVSAVVVSGEEAGQIEQKVERG